MLKLGQQINATIEVLTDKGDGIASLNGRPLYVEGALPGEQVEVMLTVVKPHFAQGKLLRLLESASSRRPDFCVYTACGGCQLRVMDYEAQLVLKRQLLMEALQAKGLDCAVADTLGMSEPFNYRNKAQYAVRSGLNKEPKIGFYAKHSHQLIEVKECRVQAAATTEVVAGVGAWMQEQQVSAYNEVRQQGSVRHLMVRNGVNTNELMVVLVVAEVPTAAALAHLLTTLGTIEGLASVMLNINTYNGNRVLGPETRLLWGKEAIVDSLAGLQFAISAQSFYQINPKQTEALYQEALRLAAPKAYEVAFDLYCGIGTISLFLARHARNVYGIEIVPEAILDARTNAELNGLANIEFLEGSAEQVVPQLYAQGVSADLVVVDPPRKGCDQALLETLIEMQPSRLVYVSCNPKSLARDLAWLTERGFRLEQATPVDMFPHTMHVEAVVLLTWQG
ncbi:23S rRNA (uracil(1939)-C(5))-methyltransferase RlmD [Oceanisphaera sp. IT1-181]|uniref:23S rRNA (uracil(1939)-C(5))-methyltransferase RlmD n=1 Tax=Oceanisphaera sp. IT1-181 TaxID=3081199 RepID=UPI0029C9B558|nr:23S rRNA (uracil(1939)-C(5))-methyltransferase RlmD [Oceanisphaera sp. IT1-181]